VLVVVVGATTGGGITAGTWTNVCGGGAGIYVVVSLVVRVVVPQAPATIMAARLIAPIAKLLMPFISSIPSFS
jgi:hypothetical protein